MPKNIVYTTLIAKLRELEQMDKALDEEYKKGKAAVRRDITRLNAAIALSENDETVDDVNELNKVKRGRKPIVFDSNNYPYTGSLKNKMLYALHEVKRFMHVREIADYIISRQPGEDRDTIIEHLGKHFYKHRQRGFVVSKTHGKSRRNVFWGLPEWVDETGKIKQGYEYDEQEITDPVSQDSQLDWNGTGWQ